MVTITRIPLASKNIGYIPGKQPFVKRALQGKFVICYILGII
jgi:hypothetical protein